jgi:esterase/lipase superfamily enzyme
MIRYFESLVDSYSENDLRLNLFDSDQNAVMVYNKPSGDFLRAVELGSISAAASEFGLTKGQVNYALQKTDQSIYLQKFREPKVVAEILAAYSDGVMTLKEIGEKFGTSAQYINTILRRNGVIGGRKRGRRPKQK